VPVCFRCWGIIFAFVVAINFVMSQGDEWPAGSIVGALVLGAVQVLTALIPPMM
jgi:uncharacterized membrane protein YjdF